MVHVGQSVGIDPRHQRRDGGEFRHVGPVDQHACGTGHRHEVQGQIGRSARGVQADYSIDEGALVEHRADGRVGIAGRGDLERPPGGRSGQRLTERRAGIYEARAGQVQAHELHQHLVRVRRAIERAGAWTVIRGHLDGHQLVSADLAAGEALAHGGLLIVRQARGHRPRRREDRRDMAEGGCRDRKPGDDLVAYAQEDRSVEAVVRQRHARRQCDHIAAEERELHARLALGDTIAHRRHAAGDLGGATCLPGRLADQRGKSLERLVGREHVVVGGDDADVAGGAAGLARLVRFRAGGEGMREVAAGEMRSRRAGVSGPGHALEICRAEGPAPRADPLGHLVHGIVQRHRVLPVIASRRPVDGGGVRPAEDQPDRGIGRASRSPCPLKRRTFARAMDQHETPARPGQRRRGQGDALLWRAGGV